MKRIFIAALLLTASGAYAQLSSPLTINGTGLNPNNEFEVAAIWSDTTNGLSFGAPVWKNTRMPIGFGWRGDQRFPFRIYSSGFVAIGADSARTRLDVLGQISSYNTGYGQLDINTSTQSFANFSTNNHGSVLVSSNLYLQGSDTLKIARTHPSLAGAAILLPGNSQAYQGGITFYTTTPAPSTVNDIYKGSLAMIIANNGNVGIGTDNPGSFKLAVDGVLGARKIKVTQQATWADFVFDNDYELPSIESLASFVKEHKHLPNVPSAKEVQEKGYDVGDMDKVLLQKLEEMTLYIIELKKSNDELKAEVDKLKRQMTN